jgi:hypothetical protein
MHVQLGKAIKIGITDLRMSAVLPPTCEAKRESTDFGIELEPLPRRMPGSAPEARKRAIDLVKELKGDTFVPMSSHQRGWEAIAPPQHPPDHHGDDE